MSLAEDLGNEEEEYEVALDRLTLTRVALGKGSYGHAFDLEQGHILKLHPNKDMAYLAFIKWVSELTQEPYTKHFPKCSRIIQCDGYIKVIMERLYKFEEATHMEQRYIPSLISPDQTCIREALDHAKNRLIYAVHDHLDQAWVHPRLKRFCVTDSLEIALQAMIHHVYIKGYACDLHDENIMFRRDLNGLVEPVIIDPFAY